MKSLFQILESRQQQSDKALGDYVKDELWPWPEAEAKKNMIKCNPNEWSEERQAKFRRAGEYICAVTAIGIIVLFVSAVLFGCAGTTASVQVQRPYLDPITGEMRVAEYKLKQRTGATMGGKLKEGAANFFADADLGDGKSIKVQSGTGATGADSGDPIKATTGLVTALGAAATGFSASQGGSGSPSPTQGDLATIVGQVRELINGINQLNTRVIALENK